MQIYKLNVSVTNDTRYTDEIADDPYVLKKEHSSFCPQCHRMSFGLKWQPPYKIKIYKKNIGDIVICHGDIIVSEKFKAEYEKNRLTGILEFAPIESVTLRDKIVDISLYLIKPKRNLFEIDYKKTLIEGDRTLKCKLCNPKGNYIDKINGIYFKEDFVNNPDDIFYIYSFGNAIFLSQKFVDIMLEKGITNLEKNITECRDYRN